MNIQELYLEYKACSGVSTDTRSIESNQIYFALKGANFNGNDYARSAIDAGCRLAVCDEDPGFESSKLLRVENVLVTLQSLAKLHRKTQGVQVLAITGSNGKTTTKELCAVILAKKYKVLATAGNLNNHIGVPLTLLSIKDEEIAVIEMGANHLGEIKDLCEIADPDVGLITNIGKAHLEGFGDLKGVRKAKGELYDYLSSKKRPAIVNMSDPVLKSMVLERQFRIFAYGENIMGEVNGEMTQAHPTISGFYTDGEEKYLLRSSMSGSYNFQNILTAATVGVFFDVDRIEIANAIASYVSENMRSQCIEGKTNRILLDAYNANPSSMKLALDSFLSSETSPKMLILGDMLELGIASRDEHRAILNYLKDKRWEHCILVGEQYYSFVEKEQFPFAFFKDLEACENYLKANPPAGLHILLKGSRGIALERLTKYLMD